MVLCRRQVDRFSTNAGGFACRVDRDRSRGHCPLLGRGGTRLRAAKHRAHLGDEFVGVERFADVCVCTQSQCEDDIALGSLGAADDDGHVVARRELAHCLDDVGTRKLRHHEVEDQQVRRSLLDIEPRKEHDRGREQDRLHGVSLQVQANELPDVIVVLEHRYAFDDLTSLSDCPQDTLSVVSDPCPGKSRGYSRPLDDGRTVASMDVNSKSRHITTQ